MLRSYVLAALVLTACSGGKVPCANDMPGPGTGCGLDGVWHGGSGSSAIELTFTSTTFSGTIGGVSVMGTYAIMGTIGCNASFTVSTDSCDTSGLDAASSSGTYGIAVGTDCNTFSLSTQSDACVARADLLGGAQLAKQQ